MTKVTIFGLGEAGRLYATGLRDLGFDVIGYDPFIHLGADGIGQASTVEDAVAEADLVISLVGAQAAETVAHTVIEAANGSFIFADFNTGSPKLKQKLSLQAKSGGVPFVDVAVLAPVPRHGALTPLMASGDGAHALESLMKSSNPDIEVVPGEAGAAAARKLIRSSFMKGFAAAIIESLSAANKAGCEDWMRQQIATELQGDPHSLIDRLVIGTQQHAARRAHEVEDTRDYLKSIDQPTWVTDAAHYWLTSFLDQSSENLA